MDRAVKDVAVLCINNKNILHFTELENKDLNLGTCRGFTNT